MWKRPLLVLSFCALLFAACYTVPDLPERAEGATGNYPLLEDPTATLLPTIVLPPTHTPQPAGPTATPTLIVPTLTPYPDDERFSIGRTWEDRDIWAWQVGEGPETIVLVGGIHGGFEGNTVVLVEQLVDHFREVPEAVLPGVRLVLIPVANPDGLARGSEIEGRFNARGVDLNRNWGCEWSDSAFLRDIPVDPGPRPFSERESLDLRAYFIAKPPAAVVFYHSAAGGIFVGSCRDEPGADWLGDLLAAATGYPHQDFSYYEVSGDASNWLAERGIPAVIVELYTRDEPEFARNLEGVMALQCHFATGGGQGEGDPAVARFCE
jgi:hypothetical protein